MSEAPGVDWGLPALRASTYPTPEALVARRAGLPPAGEPDPAADVRTQEYDGVPCTVCQPPDPSSTALYFHGGGYRMGSARRSAPFAAQVAAAAGARVVVVGYRLAPEHPFPTALYDASTVYERVLDESGGSPPVLMGDSAGGGLAAALAVAASMAGRPSPRGLVLMSPWLDLTCTAETFESRAASDELFSQQSAVEAAAMYLQGHDPNDPLASPGLAELPTWPAALVLSSVNEVLLEDSVSFVSKLAWSGSAVTGVFRRGLPHAWPAVVPDSVESQAAIATIGRFVRSLVTGEPPTL